jgi:putative lysine transport system substrate-binding protein
MMRTGLKSRVTCLVMAAVMAGSLGLTGCGSKSAKAGSGSKTAAADSGSDDKVLKVGIECTYAPYNWTQESPTVANGDKAVKIANNDGYAYGYDVKVAQMIAKKLGWKLEIYKSDWSAIFMGLNSKTYDCIMSGICYTKKRDKTLDFTTPYYCRTIKAIVRSDSKYADYTKLSQFDGQNPKVTTQAGTNYIDYKKEIPSGVSVTDYESSPECFMAIQNKTADVCILDKTTAQSALATMSGLKVLDLDKSDDFVAPKDSPNDCCIAFREGDKRRDEVNKAMKELGWTTDNKGKFDKLMDEMVKLQPSSN